MFPFPIGLYGSSVVVPKLESITVTEFTTIVESGGNLVFNMPAIRPDGDWYIAQFVLQNTVFSLDISLDESTPAGWTFPNFPIHMTNPADGPADSLIFDTFRHGNSEPASYALRVQTGKVKGFAAVLRFSSAGGLGIFNPPSAIHDEIGVGDLTVPNLSSGSLYDRSDLIVASAASLGDEERFGSAYAPIGYTPIFEHRFSAVDTDHFALQIATKEHSGGAAPALLFQGPPSGHWAVRRLRVAHA